MDRIVERIAKLLDDDLYLSCPVLSGNMRNHIDLNTVIEGDEEMTIVISAPFYDLKEWQKTKRIKFTGDIINGKHDYAEWVNTIGPFGHSGRSTHWVNRSCYEVVMAIANEIGAQVINELPLN